MSLSSQEDGEATTALTSYREVSRSAVSLSAAQMESLVRGKELSLQITPQLS